MLYYIIRAALCLTLAWLALVALGVLLYTPHAPNVSVCNQELDWGSIISGFEKLKLEADYQVSQSAGWAVFVLMRGCGYVGWKVVAYRN